jgi:asparagine N-glycosylation enzyme membrane subunit Stt3
MDLRWPMAERRGLALLACVVLLLGATGLLTQIDGTSALLQTAGNWVARFGQPGAAPWEGFVVPLLIYAPLTVLFGAIGAVFAVRERGPWGLFLAVWVVAGLLIGLLAGTPDAVADALLPLTLTAGLVLARWFESLTESASWGEEGVFVVDLMFAAPNS